jgi:hypothetical protein
MLHMTGSLAVDCTYGHNTDAFSSRKLSQP